MSVSPVMKLKLKGNFLFSFSFEDYSVDLYILVEEQVDVPKLGDLDRHLIRCIEDQ